MLRVTVSALGVAVETMHLMFSAGEWGGGVWSALALLVSVALCCQACDAVSRCWMGADLPEQLDLLQTASADESVGPRAA